MSFIAFVKAVLIPGVFVVVAVVTLLLILNLILSQVPLVVGLAVAVGLVSSRRL